MPIVVQLYSPSLDVIMLVIALAINLVLAFVVLESNPKNATNVTFALLTIFTMLWLVSTYIVRLAAALPYTLILHRLGIFWAAPLSLCFFLLAHTFPSKEFRLSKRSWLFVLSATALMMVLNISPYAFVSVGGENGALHPIPGPGLLPFSVISTIFSILAVYLLIKKFKNAHGEEKRQIATVLGGMITMLVLIIGTILLPIMIFNSGFFLPFTPLYTLAFLGATAYSITKYHLFNVKVLAAQVLTIIICIMLFARMFGEATVNASLIDGLMLGFVIVFSYFLVRSVRREVQQREQIEQLSAEKSEFMSFASHEIRNPITAMRGYASLISDGTTGERHGKTLDAAQKILVLGDEVLALIAEFLNKSKTELGQVSYHLSDVDLGAVITEVAGGYQPHARQKGLALQTELTQGENLHVKADETKIREVIGNLVDNSFKYTREGSITISAHRFGVHTRVIISDTGIGITPETMPVLFRKFSRGDAERSKILGTGIGLYLAKVFVEGMGARIWAESEGKDKGSRFIIEFSA